MNKIKNFFATIWMYMRMPFEWVYYRKVRKQLRLWAERDMERMREKGRAFFDNLDLFDNDSETVSRNHTDLKQ